MENRHALPATAVSCFMCAIVLGTVALHPLLADDAVGVLDVHVVSNEDVAVTMPFAPLGDATPGSFLSGNFMGDGEACSDKLYRLALADSAYASAVFSAESGWLDPSAGGPTDMVVERGDALVFAPGCDAGLDFWLFGRVPGLAPYSGLPRIRSMSVSPTNGLADIEILSRGRVTDILAQNTADGFPDSAPWTHLDRISVASAPSFVWRDVASPFAGARLYLASDATRDADGDGLPDALELRVYGTSPYLRDTDGDGIDDALEIAWGMDPLAADEDDWSVIETFEPPAVTNGTVDAQHGWNATVPEAASRVMAVHLCGERRVKSAIPALEKICAASGTSEILRRSASCALSRIR